MVSVYLTQHSPMQLEQQQQKQQMRFMLPKIGQKDLAYNLVDNLGNRFLSNHKGKLMTRKKEDLTTFNSSENRKKTKIWFCIVFTYFIS